MLIFQNRYFTKSINSMNFKDQNDINTQWYTYNFNIYKDTADF